MNWRIAHNLFCVIVIIVDDQYSVFFFYIANDLYVLTFKFFLQFQNSDKIFTDWRNNDIHFFHQKTLLLIVFPVQLNLSITVVKLKLQLL